ncbi:amidohydrolase family protein [Ekhidna sp.]|jgi:imidazolonepropionase-like amidohydrolase|uniref:amidohydrolase family protein n=1 Tax=Ekhidna sp. TaxID=2608089 RepID=UPI0032ECAF12
MQKCDSLVRSVCMLFLIGVMPLIGLAQDSDLKPVTNKYAIKNATIVQAPGKTIQNGTILIENGIIKAVGSSVAIPADAWVVDADSMFVYAGFISGLSNIGIEKPKEEEQKDDRKLTGNPTYERAGITPGNSAREMLKPDDKSVEDFRKLGFTASHSVPHNGMLPGTGTIILLGGKDGESMVVKDQTSMYSQLSGAGGVYPNTVIGVMAKYRDLYRKAIQARDYESKYNSNPNGMERPATDATLQALYPVVSKQMTVAFKAEGVKDIMRVTTLQKDLGFKMMLGEVKQGWDAIPTIKPTGAPVFLSLDLPEWKQEEEKNKEDEDDEEESEEKEPTESELEEKALKERQNAMIKNYYTQAGKFRSNGIKFGFSTMEVKSKDFKTNLLKVIENGLSEDHALAALTTEPARILGVSSQMGTIEAGKMANLIVSDTAYFTKDANVRFVFVDGVKYEYEAKKKKKSNGDEAVDASGVWNYTTETPQGNGSGVITLKGTPGDYSGTITVSFNGSTNDIENVVVDGSNVSFSFKLNMGEEITVDISMDIDGDTFEGTLSVAAFGSFPMEGSREPNK